MRVLMTFCMSVRHRRTNPTYCFASNVISCVCFDLPETGSGSVLFLCWFTKSSMAVLIYWIWQVSLFQFEKHSPGCQFVTVVTGLFCVLLCVDLLLNTETDLKWFSVQEQLFSINPLYVVWMPAWRCLCWNNKYDRSVEMSHGFPSWSFW